MKMIANLSLTRWLLALSFLFFSTIGHAAETTTASSKNKNPFPVKYISDADQKINLKTICLAPVYDNVNRVYAEPIEKLLIDLLQTDKVWGYTKFQSQSKNNFIETFETKAYNMLFD